MNAVFVTGRGIIIFAVFGLEYDTVIKPMIRLFDIVRALYNDPDPSNWRLYKLY